ncbi:hypothetical protein RHSIM_Rhsim04G0122200 [Rhododendron simsii]|uniref:Transmembrane protein n=1 Tax=Rhododendron simsii TaxID=118357 RepID=A0A834GZA4_RHOSS|nr:hypothetical protein RHSIM_Rhsim04G0122200 [Rhododendron simsii]
MVMQPERQQKLRINVDAKAKTFHFKFKAITILPTTSKLFPFPIKLNLNLKLCPSLLQSKKSEQQFPFPRRGKSWKLKFLWILGKIRPRPSKNKATASDETSNLGHPDAHFLSTQLRHFPFEEPMCISSIVIGFIALLSQSIFQNNQKGMVLYTLIILLYLALILKKYFSRRTRNLMVIAIVALLCCAIWVYLRNILKTDCFWKSCMELCSSLGQTVHSSFSQYIGAHRGDNYLRHLTFNPFIDVLGGD